MEQLPSKEQILQWITDNPGLGAKRDIAKAFGIKGAARIELKRMLKELEADGKVAHKKRNFREKGALPPVSLLIAEAPDASGDIFLKPMEWDGEGEAPRVLLIAAKGDVAVGRGDKVLARLSKVDLDAWDYEARLIRKLGVNSVRVLGIYRTGGEGGRIVPIDKGQDKEWRVPRDMTLDARDGELVEAEAVGKSRNMGLPTARIIERLGDPTGPRAVSLIAIHQHGIPDQFPDNVIAEADRAQPATLGKREDLRDLPLVTIDPVDARDRDDAVYAAHDDAPDNKGGFVIWVAIADVAYYVRPGSALDREAKRRGNSTYFPDRVVPMLPDILSGDLCSLHSDVDRACMAVRMRIDAEGNKIDQRFTRGLMRSKASLSYEQVQTAIDGNPDEISAPLLEPILKPLYAAYAALKKARVARQPLELDLPERRIILSDEGKVLSVAFKERFDAHKLIEECMVLANVAAAEELIKLKTPLLFRIHEEPPPDRLNSLREVAESSGFVLAKGQVLQTKHLNQLLSQAQGSEFDELINISTLRSMTQAYYNPANFGHFGLALKNYAHFTSPIRRYSDLIVHRGLISGHRWGNDGLTAQEIEALEETAKQISDTERRSMTAERDTTDRYLAAYLSDRVGAEFTGRISGVQRFGVFVKLDETGADGLVPVRAIGREFFHYDEASQSLIGADTGAVVSLGQRVIVRLTEAIPVTGGLILDLVSIEDQKINAAGLKGRGKGGRYSPRKPGKAKAREAKIARKVIRKRR